MHHPGLAKLVEGVKVPATKPEDMSSGPTHMVEGENKLLHADPEPPHMPCGAHCPTHTK